MQKDNLNIIFAWTTIIKNIKQVKQYIQYNKQSNTI